MNNPNNVISGFIKIDLINESFFIDNCLLQDLGYHNEEIKTISNFVDLTVSFNDKIKFKNKIEELRRGENKAN